MTMPLSVRTELDDGIQEYLSALLSEFPDEPTAEVASIPYLVMSGIVEALVPEQVFNAMLATIESIMEEYYGLTDDDATEGAYDAEG